jgi:hypothetical protein
MRSTVSPADRCFVCGTSRDIEPHHLAGRHRHPATVPLCKFHHREQTGRQRAAGLHDRLTIHADRELVALIALIEGVTGLLAAHARHHRRDAFASRVEGYRRELTRTITLAADTTPGLLGPRPSANRSAGPGDTARSHVRADSDHAGSSAGDAASLFRVVVDMLDDLAPGCVPDSLRRQAIEADGACWTSSLATGPRAIRIDAGLIAGVEHLTDTIAAVNDKADSHALERTP